MTIMNKRFFVYALISAGVASASFAQNLTEEVVIDREITPVIRNVVRPNWVTPSILTPRVEKTRLSFYEYTGTTDITRSVPQLEPISWADSVMRSPYRGYASLGYFPSFNLNAAAGYRFIHNKTMDVGAKISYDGHSWTGFEGAETKSKQNELMFGVDGTFRFKPGTLTADFGYTYSSTTPAEYPEPAYNRGNQAINMVDLSLKWKPASTGKFQWDAAANLGYGGFTKNMTDQLMAINTVGIAFFDYVPLKDVTFNVASDLAYNLSDASGIALGVGLNLRHLNKFNTVYLSSFTTIDGESHAHIFPKQIDSNTLGIITLTPGYKFVSGKISGRLGVRVDFNTGGEEKNVRIAPDVEINWAPASLFAVYLHAKGGEVMNSNRELWQRNPWMTGTIAQERSHVNADIDLGVTFGSYKGFWATLHGGWSNAGDWMTPVVAENINTWWRINSFKGFDFGLQVGYAWKKYFTVQANFDGASHRNYYRWQDNAKWAFNVSAKVRPIDKLRVEIGYDTRISRQGWIITPEISANGNPVFTAVPEPLGNASNFFAGAEYEITRPLSVFLNVENILNRRWSITNNIRSEGIHGLLGLQFKF